ncbi:glutamate--cysteine ligase [Roseiconus nitratireducens]|uniref:Glutamate--cysteine ligase n=1 Tax=Roseiconus nitratireducens TaxID=2605748 RepID=A0A5M6D5G4_9BACT|nr:glutamate-cysteine ligase family protein [Roseiconus nitratireducens]KAA5541820.1 glutamate--cysteine ligase [Roseiconus nitratireducens]
MSDGRYHLFDAYGVEMEYMLVDRQTLEVRPVADRLLALIGGAATTSDCELGPVTLSNELTAHVVELKCTRPIKSLDGFATLAGDAIRSIQQVLDQLQLSLLPTAMHPWMDPTSQTVLWPHENHEIYQAFDRIFDCRSHGWANVQSVHLNLPFADDQEFGRLHSAVRLILPILPALAASSPIVDGQLTTVRDNRLQHYSGHCRRLPSLVGDVIPEPLGTEREYRRQILSRIGAEIRPHDPDQVLQEDFLNARGAIARFDRGSIEIRVMDVQECPAADMAICALVIAVLRTLVLDPKSVPVDQRNRIPTRTLRSILDAVIRDAENASIDDREFLNAFGMGGSECRAGELWRVLLERLAGTNASLDPHVPALQVILEQGTLASRIANAVGDASGAAALRPVYRRLADCLRDGRMFEP